MTRKDVREVGSPIFHIIIGDIADGAFEQHDLNQEASVQAKYIPYDFIEITNSSALNLELTLNDIHHFIVPGNVTTVKSDIPFNRFRLTNESGSALTGTDIYVSVQHTPLTEDKLIREPVSLASKLMRAVPFLGLMR